MVNGDRIGDAHVAAAGYHEALVRDGDREWKGRVDAAFAALVADESTAGALVTRMSPWPVSMKLWGEILRESERACSVKRGDQGAVGKPGLR